MSQENVELARRFAEAFNVGDTDGALAIVEAHLAPDYEFDPLYIDRVYRGVGAMRQAAADMAEQWQDYRNQIEEIVDLGDHVLHVSRITGRGAGGGVPVDQRVFMVTRFDGGTALWTRSYSSRAEALQAAG